MERERGNEKRKEIHKSRSIPDYTREFQKFGQGKEKCWVVDLKIYSPARGERGPPT